MTAAYIALGAIALAVLVVLLARWVREALGKPDPFRNKLLDKNDD